MTRVSCRVRILKFILALVLSLVAVIYSSPASEADMRVNRTWGKPVEAQAVSIGSPKAAYAPGEPIRLKACFKNVGQKDVKVVYTDPLALYQLSVQLPDGKPAPLTLFGIQGETGPRISSESRFGTLKAGEVTCDEIELTRLFDFTLPGKYTVSAQRVVSVNSRLKATSNNLEITVDESLGRGLAGARPPTDKKKWGSAIEGQAVSIATDVAAYNMGEPVPLHICFKERRGARRKGCAEESVSDVFADRA